MDEKREASKVDYAANHIKETVCRLKILYDASTANLDSRSELNAFRDITQVIVANEIEHLNVMLEDSSHDPVQL